MNQLPITNGVAPGAIVWATARLQQQDAALGFGHLSLVISREPCPQLQPHPVDHLAGPDPDEQPAVDLDLAHALHAGPETPRRARKLRLDVEVVASLARRGDRRDLPHLERQGLVGK